MKRWTKEEDLIIIEYYGREGKKILSRLPGRTFSALKGHLIKLGIHHGRKGKEEAAMPLKRWTKEEDDIIREHYPKEGSRIESLLPGRTRPAIKLRANVLKVSCELYPGTDWERRWTEEDLEILREFYPKEGSSGVRERLEHRFTTNEIQKKANKRGLHREGYDREAAMKQKEAAEAAAQRWTEEDKELLRKFYSSKGAKGLYRRFKKRFTIHEINRKANKMGLHRE